MERLAYFIKHRLTFLFPIVERFAALVTKIRYGKGRSEALAQATVEGFLGDKPCVVRALKEDDAMSVSVLLNDAHEAHTEYFHPHKFDVASVRKVLRSSSFMTYGLFLDDRVIAYALLRLAPNGAAYIGRLVDEKFAGKGIGKYLARYLYWQAGTAGFRPRSTISQQNYASLKSHESVAGYNVIATLPNDYLMIEFDTTVKYAPSLKL